MQASHQLFVHSTSWASYLGRIKAVRDGDLRSRLGNIDVPTLVLSPSYDHLVGVGATLELRQNIVGAKHVVLANTGHMFRFSHPRMYAASVIDFLNRAGITGLRDDAEKL